ncbi:MAG: DUF2778 domain-containing protein [Acidobacteria bacterium]|nr:DUF2778 domain-containing protein [Acidobacteriota bacterium]
MFFEIYAESGLGYDEVPETRKGYTGYEKDEESGLDFAQARYYNPKHGRYTSVDPLTASANVKNPQTFNRYSYVLNSPYKFTDPLGLISSTTGANGGAWCSTCDSQDGPGGFLEEDSAGPADSGPAPESTSNDTNGPPASNNVHSPETQPSATPPPPPPPPVGDFDNISVSMVFSISNRLLTVTVKKHVYNGDDIVSTYEFGGSSGTGECLNNPDCAVDDEKNKDKGPIPIGNYTIASSNMVDLTEPGASKTGKLLGTRVRKVFGTAVTPDWGSFRISIQPDEKLKVRSEFFLHGGSFPGSKGCIDIGGGEYDDDNTQTMIKIKAGDIDGKIPLKVIK